MKGELWLFPNALGNQEGFFPTHMQRAVEQIVGLIGESEKEMRAFLRRFISRDEMQRKKFSLLNEHTETEEIASLLKGMEAGEVWGLISDAGLPCIADPGAPLVALCHQKGIRVKSFGGSSSILIALQLSGFSGQHFSFHGYLPRESFDLEAKLLAMEVSRGTQIWIEAPYRSAKMIETVKAVLHPKTRFCVAANLCSLEEKIYVGSIDLWKKSSWTIGKEVAIFLLDGSSAHPQ